MRMNTSLRAPIHPVLPWSRGKKKKKNQKFLLATMALKLSNGAGWETYMYMQGSTPADLCINLV